MKDILKPLLITVGTVLGVLFILNMLATSSPKLTGYFGIGAQSN
jgi:hypothetical protein